MSSYRSVKIADANIIVSCLVVIRGLSSACVYACARACVCVCIYITLGVRLCMCVCEVLRGRVEFL